MHQSFGLNGTFWTEKSAIVRKTLVSGVNNGRGRHLQVITLPTAVLRLNFGGRRRRAGRALLWQIGGSIMRRKEVSCEAEGIR